MHGEQTGTSLITVLVLVVIVIWYYSKITNTKVPISLLLENTSHPAQYKPKLLV